MRYSLKFFAIVMVSSLVAPVVSAQDEEGTKADTEAGAIAKAPVPDEFSRVMRNLMQRAKSNKDKTSKESPSSKLDSKVDDIQSVLNKSDEQVANVERMKSSMSSSPSHSLEDKEVETLKTQIKVDKALQVKQLLATKAKIAQVRKTITDEKKKLALDKANASVEKALKLLEENKEQ